MRLVTAHKALMACAIAGCGAFAFYAGMRAINEPSGANLVIAGGAGIATVTVAYYLRSFSRRLSQARPTEKGES